MPASAHAATSGSPYSRYGPTVVMSTRVDRAISASEAVSWVSATTMPGAGTSGISAASRAATASSLVRLRPATAQEPPSGMFRSR